VTVDSLDSKAKQQAVAPYDLHLTAYKYEPVTTIVGVLTGPTVAPQLMTLDNFVTLSETAAGNLTTIATLDDLYDAAKHWKTRSVSAQLRYPTLGTQPATASGTLLDLGSLNLIVDASAAAAFAINTSTNTITIKASALTKGAKFLSVKTTGTVTVSSGVTLSNLIFDSSVTQATPTTPSNVSISGVLEYLTNTATSINYINCTINEVRNAVTGLVTITPIGSTVVTTYTDPEINYLDSNLTATGITSATIYPSEADRDANTNPGPTLTTVLNFKLGSTVSGVVMTGTVYLRVNVSGLPCLCS